MVVIKLNCSLCHICAIVPCMYHMYYMCLICTICAISVPAAFVKIATLQPLHLICAQLQLWFWWLGKCKCWQRWEMLKSRPRWNAKKRGFRIQGQSLVVQKRLVEEEGMVKARDLRPVSSKSAFSCRQKSASKDKISKDQLCAKVLSCCAAQQENPFKLLPLSTNGSWVLYWYRRGMQLVAYLVSSLSGTQ